VFTSDENLICLHQKGSQLQVHSNVQRSRIVMVKHTSFPFPRTSKNALESDKKKKSQNDGCADPAFKFQRERETLTFQWDGVCSDEHLSSLTRPLRLTFKALMHLKRKYKRATPRHSIVRISDTNSHPSTESIEGQIKDVFHIIWS